MLDLVYQVVNTPSPHFLWPLFLKFQQNKLFGHGKIQKLADFQKTYETMSEEKKNFLRGRIGHNAAKLEPEQLIAYLFNNSNKANFAETYFDGTLLNISTESVQRSYDIKRLDNDYFEE